MFLDLIKQLSHILSGTHNVALYCLLYNLIPGHLIYAAQICVCSKSRTLVTISSFLNQLWLRKNILRNKKCQCVEKQQVSASVLDHERSASHSQVVFPGVIKGVGSLHVW